MENPLISICMPAYKGEHTVVKAIQSILDQTYKNIEVIVVDDCSPDNTYELVQTIKDERLKLYRNNTNLGMVGNWNKSVSYATGKYVHMVHSDDILLPNCIENKVKFLESHPNDDFVMIFNATQIINENGKVLMNRHYTKRNLVLDGKLLALESLRKRNLYGEPSNVLFRKDAFDYVGGFFSELKYVTDWDMWLRLSPFGKVGYIDMVLVKYRVSTTNVTSSLTIKQMVEDDNLMLKNIQKMKEYDLSFFQIFYHKLIFRIRALMRYFYMRFFAN